MKNDVLIVRDLIDKAVQNYGLEAVRKTVESILDFYEKKEGEEENINDADIAMRESLGENWW